jgi:hypothetical protein
MTQKIIVIEDNERFGNDAKETLGAKLVTTFAEFETELAKEKPDVVLSDLYYPTGYIGEKDEQLRESVLVLFDQYIKKIYRPNPVGRALETVLELGVFGKTMDDYFDALKNDIIVKAYKDNIASAYKSYQEMTHYQSLREGIKEKFCDPPSGIFAYRLCEEMSIPCIIVTSAYHHGIEFQPFVNHVGRYLDTLIEGKKPWKKALDTVSNK